MSTTIQFPGNVTGPTAPAKEPENALDAGKPSPDAPPPATPDKAPPAAPDGKPPVEPPKPEDKKPDAPAESPEPLKAFHDEFAKNGKLSEESYAALQKLGHSKAVVDTYIAGIQASQSGVDSARVAQEAKILESVGGSEQFSKVREWAKSSLSPAELTAYNQAVNEGTPEQAALAVAGLNAKYTSANGRPARLIQGQTRDSSEGAYRSWAEVRAAMSDPRYKADEAYRGDVQKRLNASNI